MNLIEIRGPHVIGDVSIFQLVEWEGEAFPHTELFPDRTAKQVREASPSGNDSRITNDGMIVFGTYNNTFYSIGYKDTKWKTNGGNFFSIGVIIVIIIFAVVFLIFLLNKEKTSRGKELFLIILTC